MERLIATKGIGKVLPLLAISLLAPWPLAYAYNYAGEMSRQNASLIRIAEPSITPAWTVFGNAIGSVTPGDLYYVDATNNAVDVVATLLLTNPEALIHYYRYLMLNVGVYVESEAGKWEKARRSDGGPISDTFITLHNAELSFPLAAHARYKVTIDGGAFYSTQTAGGDYSPKFYLVVK